MTFKAFATALALALALALLPETAMAYVGPGAGISLIGSTIGLLLALTTALGFVVLWPLRQLLRRRFHARAAVGSEGGPEGRERM